MLNPLSLGFMAVFVIPAGLILGFIGLVVQSGLTIDYEAFPSKMVKTLVWRHECLFKEQPEAL